MIILIITIPNNTNHTIMKTLNTTYVCESGLLTVL